MPYGARYLRRRPIKIGLRVPEDRSLFKRFWLKRKKRQGRESSDGIELGVAHLEAIRMALLPS
jgi:hypothetical protein